MIQRKLTNKIRRIHGLVFSRMMSGEQEMVPIGAGGSLKAAIKTFPFHTTERWEKGKRNKDDER